MRLVYLPFLLALVLSPCLIDGFEEVPCQSLSIRSFEKLEKLKNCTVVLGNLALLFPLPFIDPEYTSEEINKQVFPLREITGYFLVAYVAKLDSLGRMFPNLTVIRGRQLLGNYAFKIGFTDIREITLKNLQMIQRGSVSIGGDNKRLCLPEKYDWNAVIKKGNFVVQKKPGGTNCPKSDRCNSCPGAAHDKCWHNDFCQRLEPFYRKLNSRFQCHNLCVGGCSDDSAKGCSACLDLKDEDECVEKCPEDKYIHDDFRRCVTKSACEKMRRKIFENRCVKECPANFTTALTAEEEKGGRKSSIVCFSCIDCPRLCPWGEISTIADIEYFGRGCSQVPGNLEINIFQDLPHIMDELREYLGHVESIHGTLFITRSPALTDLSFLKNLKLVKGEPYVTAIMIHDNRNLQATVDLKEKIVVQNGSVKIFNNKLLCPSEVSKFMDKLERNKTKEDWIRYNGKESHCTDATITTRFKIINFETVAISWKDEDPEKHKIYSGFNIRYVPVDPSHSHDKVFELRKMDSCSIFGWEHKYVSKSELTETADGYLETLLTGLQQLTTYDFAVETYMYSLDDEVVQKVHSLDPDLNGASSKPKRFKTPMRVPSRVRNFYPTEIKKSSMKFAWSILENEASGIDFFYIDVEPIPLNATQTEARNYCEMPTEIYESETDDDDFVKRQLAKYDSERFDSVRCCKSCCGDVNKDETLKLPGYALRKQLEQLCDSGYKEFSKISSKNRPFSQRFASNYREGVIDKLSSFTQYRFSMYVCAGDDRCSSYEMVTLTTDMDRTLEKVALGDYHLEGQNLHVTFNEPASNGLIISYNINIEREFHVGFSERINYCVTRKKHEERNYRFVAKNLDPGTYTFQVRANSIARYGPYTEKQKFEVVPFVTETWRYIWAVCFLLVIFLITISCVVCFSRPYPRARTIILLRGLGNFLRRLFRITQQDDLSPLITEGGEDVPMAPLGIGILDESDEVIRKPKLGAIRAPSPVPNSDEPGPSRFFGSAESPSKTIRKRGSQDFEAIPLVENLPARQSSSDSSE